MRHLLLLTILIVLSMISSAEAVELKPLADCSIKVFKEINRTNAWSGKPPAGCWADIRVERRPSGIFVTAWNSSNSDNGWEMVSMSSAMGFYEVGNKKALEKAAHDISKRAAHIERCLESILKLNDPLECRDRGTKIYSAGDEMGIEFKRSVWLDDGGRHCVVEYDTGDTSAAVSPAPADLFGGTALPPGTKLNLHVFDIN